MRRSLHAARARCALALILVFWLLVPGAMRIASAAPRPALKVMTYNVYYGAALETLFLATPENLFQLVGEVWAQAQATDMPGRAEEIADLITAADPHVVGLQETPLWRSQSPGDGLLSPATTVRFDFLELLLDALDARGHHYEAVASVTNLDAELPRLDPFSPPTFIEDIRLTDRDVIIVRADLPADVFSVSNAQAANFEQNLVFPFGVFAGVEVPRGWTAVDITLLGRSARVINTHLERFSPPDQEAQAQEILDGPADTSLPVVLLGDLNSAAGDGAVPGESDTDTFEDLLAAGFVDAWSEKQGSSGFTCCQTADLDDPSTLSERIDYVLARGELFVAAATRVGEEEGDRTSSGLWPSDHVGVSAVLRFG